MCTTPSLTPTPHPHPYPMLHQSSGNVMEATGWGGVLWTADLASALMTSPHSQWPAQDTDKVKPARQVNNPAGGQSEQNPTGSKKEKEEKM